VLFWPTPLRPAVYAADFAGDLPKAEAGFMALSQMPVAGKAFGTPINAPVWMEKPTDAIVATQDRLINPELQRWMYQRAKAYGGRVPASTWVDRITAEAEVTLFRLLLA